MKNQTRILIHLLAIASAVLLIYSNTLDAPFVLDDNPNIVMNPAIRDVRNFLGLRSAERLESHLPINDPLLKTRSVGYLTFSMNFRLHGLEVGGYHLVNIAIHLLNSLLLYLFVSLALRTPFFSDAAGNPSFHRDSGRRVALFAALFFAVHPVQTQAVTYIVQRFTSLTTLFYLLALTAYAIWRERVDRGGLRRLPTLVLYAVSLLSAVLAMRTKEFAFTLPVVMALYELTFFEGKVGRRMLPITPFILSPLLIPLALWESSGSLAGIAGVSDEGLMASTGLESVSKGAYLLTQFRVILTYLRLLIFPANQNIDHDYPVFESFLNPAVFLSFLVLLSIVALGLYLYRSTKKDKASGKSLLRLVAFGIFFFIITTSAESFIVPVVDLMFEHRLYLPTVGFFMALAGTAEFVILRWGRGDPRVRRAAVSVMIALVLVLSIATYRRNDVWTDSVKLWKNAVEGSPGKARTHHYLGLAYADKGMLGEAINEYRLALKIKPDYAFVHFGLGYAYGQQGRFDKAVEEYRTMLSLVPDFSPARNNLAMIYMSQGRKADAIREFRILLRQSPGSYPMAAQFLEFLQGK